MKEGNSGAKAAKRDKEVPVTAAKLFGGISLVTTLPAPITQLSPIVTPGQTVTDAPNQQSFPI